MIEYDTSKMKFLTKKHNAGFSLVEGLISIAIFVILSMAIYETVAGILKNIRTYRESITTSVLADQYMEIVRNMPYSEIGSLSGNPHGNLPDFPNATQLNIDDNDYKIYYVVNYIDDPADGTILTGTDTSANDYKQVKMYVMNTTTGKTSSFLTNIAPKSLESLVDGGALYIKVFGANGQPIPNATLRIINVMTTSTIDLTRTTDENGVWTEVGLPSSNNSYHIIATKDGYSTDQTLPITTSNPNPYKPNSTVVNGEVTKISLSIDKLSDLKINTLNQFCKPLVGIGMEIRGTKLLGINPEIYKYDGTYSSNANGKITLSDIEWDTYTPKLTGSEYSIYGSSPIQQINVLPGANQTFTFILGPKTNNNLLVIVKDSSTNNPIEGASVKLEGTQEGFHETKVTGGSVWSQKSWSGGNGQSNWDDQTKYLDGLNVSTELLPEALRLTSYDDGLTYSPSGYAISSTFDTGTASTTFTNIEWQPASQTASTSVKFQVATNNDNATWNFVGPDGTSDSYYTVSGTDIKSGANRYIRYKIFLETSDTSVTPVISNVNINYVSGCFTPGQVIFTNLTPGTDYKITASKDGYEDQIADNLNISSNNADLSITLTN